MIFLNHGDIMKKSIKNGFNSDNSTKSPFLNFTYMGELNKIKADIKKEKCVDLKECLELFQELWLKERADYNILISSAARKKLGKVADKDKKQYSQIKAKIEKIAKNPEHFKPLSGDFHGSRRVHIGDFVLIYIIDGDNIILEDYNHHDHIYIK